MVDADEGQRPGVSDRLGGAEPDEQRSDEPGAAGRRDAFHPIEGEAAPFERVFDHRDDVRDVIAGRELGHHPAVRCVHRVLGAHDARALASVFQHGGGGVVTGGLDPEDDHGSESLCSAARAVWFAGYSRSARR